MSIIKINYPNEILNLTKEEFIDKYLIQENENIYSLKIIDNSTNFFRKL